MAQKSGKLEGAVSYIWNDTGTGLLSSATYLALTLNNLATVTGRQGVHIDLDGVDGIRPDKLLVRGYFEHQTQPVLSEVVEAWAKWGWDDPESSARIWLNDDGEGDIALSAEDKLKNLAWIGSAIVDEEIINKVIRFTAIIDVQGRYFAPVIYNRSVDSLENVNDSNYLIVTPLYNAI